MEKIDQYLPLYLGQKVQFTDYECAPVICKLVGVCTQRTDHEEGCRIQLFEEDGEDGYEGRGIIWADEDTIELVLRPLSSMTEDEVCSIFSEKFAPNFSKRQIKRLSESLYSYHQLLSEYGDENTEIKLREMGFDLYRLKEKGLCLYPEEL